MLVNLALHIDEIRQEFICKYHAFHAVYNDIVHVSRAMRHTAVRHCSLLVYQSVNYALVGGATVITLSVSHYCFYARGFFVIVLNGEL